jgi:hypothetical protein
MENPFAEGWVQIELDTNGFHARVYGSDGGIRLSTAPMRSERDAMDLLLWFQAEFATLRVERGAIDVRDPWTRERQEQLVAESELQRAAGEHEPRRRPWRTPPSKSRADLVSLVRDEEERERRAEQGMARRDGEDIIELLEDFERAHGRGSPPPGPEGD